MSAPNPSVITWLVLVPLIAWRLVVRFRRLTQRQRLSRLRPWITLTVFPMLLGLLAMTAFVPPAPPQPWKLAWLVCGLVLGGLLALYGLKRTQFEAIAGDGLYYTPDARLGIAISVLFLLRLVWRLGELVLHGTAASQAPQFVLSPWTLAPIGVFSGYFMIYAAGLLLWRRKALKREKLSVPKS
jgi:hypothetical protein